MSPPAKASTRCSGEGFVLCEKRHEKAARDRSLQTPEEPGRGIFEAVPAEQQVDQDLVEQLAGLLLGDPMTPEEDLQLRTAPLNDPLEDLGLRQLSVFGHHCGFSRDRGKIPQWGMEGNRRLRRVKRQAVRGCSA